jgi:hypothetical protein
MAKQATQLAEEQPAAPTEIRPTHEDIAALAYAVWQEKGCPAGTLQEDWLRAEQELAANPAAGCTSVRTFVVGERGSGTEASRC